MRLTALPAVPAGGPRLGIGLPVYNGERFLAATLASLQAQTYTDFEVLILDNASTDASGDIARAVCRQDNRFRYERKPETTSAPENFNDVFARMANELFAWQAGDDLHQPDFLAACVAAKDAHAGAIGGFTMIEAIDENGVWIRDDNEPIRFDVPDPAIRMLDLASYRHSCQTIFSVFERRVMERVGPMCSCWGSDRMYLAEIALHGPVAIAPERYFRNRVHSTRLGGSGARSSLFHGKTPPYRAITFHYAGHLRRAARKAPLSPWERRQVHRALIRWTAENSGNLARSGGRLLIETAKAARSAVAAKR